MKANVERKMMTGLVIVLLLMAVIGWVSYRCTVQLVDNSRRISDITSTRRKARDVLLIMEDLETGMRGYVISGEEPYLQPYNTAVAGVNEHLQELSAAIGYVPGQEGNLAKLKQIIADELAFTAKVVQTRKNDGFDAARNLLKTGQGKAQMDQIRLFSGKIVDAAEHIRQEQDRVTANQAQRTIWTILFGNIFGTVFVAGACVFIHKDMGQRKKAEEMLRESEERFRALVEGAREYAIFLLDAQGCIKSWNIGGERVYGYSTNEIIGKHFSIFYPAEDIKAGKPQRELNIAMDRDQYEEEGWRQRKGGEKLWASVSITTLRDQQGTHLGFAKIVRNLSERKRSEEMISSLNKTLQLHNAQLEAVNRELEAFSYSVSHDLRAPLRSLDGFSQALLEDFSTKLDDEGKDYLNRIRGASQRMGQLIDDLLNLSRVTRWEMSRETVDLSKMAKEIVAELCAVDPNRQAEFVIADGLSAEADPRLARVVLTNLLSNAWKFSGKKSDARIEFGCSQNNGSKTYFVKDNGVGFDMAHANKLFGAFQRLHAMTDFPGTGVGLATVQRIIHRHGGKISAQSAPNAGAMFQFTF